MGLILRRLIARTEDTVELVVQLLGGMVTICGGLKS